MINIRRRSHALLILLYHSDDRLQWSFLPVLAKISYSAPKSTISLAEGMPNEETFPFTEISVKLCDGSSFTLNDDELGAALQYVPTQGYPPFLQVEIIFYYLDFFQNCPV